MAGALGDGSRVVDPDVKRLLRDGGPVPIVGYTQRCRQAGRARCIDFIRSNVPRLTLHLAPAVIFSAVISVMSPRKILFSLSKKYIFWIKVSKKAFY